jgi:hypothetical protein
MRIGGNTVTDLQARGAGFAINENLRSLGHGISPLEHFRAK